MTSDKSFGKLYGISLDNFRLFKNISIDFKPITVLTGPNNSGKSSIIKVLLLIDDNIKMGKFDAGGFLTELDFTNKIHQLSSPVLCLREKSKPMGISLKVSPKDYYYVYLFNEKGVNAHDVLITSGSDTILFQDEDVLLIDLAIFADYLFDFIKIQDDLINQSDKRSQLYKKMTKNRKIENIHIPISELNKLRLLFKKVSEKLNQMEKKSESSQINFKYEDISEWISNNKRIKNEFSLGQPVGADLTSLFFEYLFEIDPFDEETIFELFPPLRGFHDKEGLNIFYIPAIKGLLERSFSVTDTSIIKELIKEAIEVDKTNEIGLKIFDLPSTSKSFIKKWIKVFQLGKNLNYGYDENKGVYYILLDGRSLLDYGYGANQLISAMLFLSTRIESSNCSEKTVIFEEPECNLHPNFQSLFIEMLVEVNKEFGLNFIIETHSEYMIRKLQYLTAKKKIKPEDSVIYYFNHPDEVAKGAEQVKEINILEDGSLSDNFGKGFYDEADNLAMELYRFQRNKANKN